MTKAFLCILLLMFQTQGLFASEKAESTLQQYGFSAEEFAGFEKKYPELSDLDVALDRRIFFDDTSTEHFAIKLYAEDSNDVYTVTKVGPSLNIERDSLPLESEIKTIEGEIRGTLSETIRKDLGSEALGKEMEEAFSDDFSTTKGLRVGASYSIEVREYLDEGRFVKYGSILRASLMIGRAVSKKILKINPENFSWKLLPEDVDLEEKPFYAPVKSKRVSSLFQLNRRHPVTRRHQPHNGIDFAAPSGTPVYPALEGEVIAIARTRSKGKYITILHDNGYQTTYIHLRKFQKGLRVGMRVSLEDKIGEVGRTGYATGAHLHFGVIKDGYFVNPIYLLKTYSYDQKDQYESLPLDGETEDQGILEGDVLPIDSEE